MKTQKTIQHRASFDIIRYANCWEDAEILVQSLNICEGSYCLSIASSGDNSLAILSQNPALVLTVDLSPVQLACVEIRKIAFAELEYSDLLSFLGTKESVNDRLDTYKTLQKYLSSHTRTFWDNNTQIIADGIIHHGKFEKFFQIFHRYILPLVHNKKKVMSLLQKKSKQERIEFYNKYWNTLRWKLMFKIFFSRYILGRLGRDPEFFKYVEGSVADRILERAKYAITILPTHENPYLNYILTKNFQDALPYYLRKENYDKIKNNLDKLELFHGTVESALKARDRGFDAYNLSDIFEYMDRDLFSKVAEGLLQYANKNARLAYWNLLVHRKISDILPEKTQYLQQLSEKLFQKDQAFFYKSFYVDEVIK